MGEIGELKYGITITKCSECERVEVVRCKDCRYQDKGFCHHPEQRYLAVFANHFCGHGEKRGGGNEDG